MDAADEVYLAIIHAEVKKLPEPIKDVWSGNPDTDKYWR